MPHARIRLRAEVEATLAETGRACDGRPDLDDILNDLYPQAVSDAASLS